MEMGCTSKYVRTSKAFESHIVGRGVLSSGLMENQ